MLDFNLSPHLAFLPNMLCTQMLSPVSCLHKEMCSARKNKGNFIFLVFQYLLCSVFVLRLLENSMMNAEVKEGEILPPTIQRLMKGYNKYLRPFFDSKEMADTCTHTEDNAPEGNVFDSEQDGSYCNFVLACPSE